ncbi:hypothetical protein Glove_109g268 [Diversispora epigaea]|uniref:Uncharacterized protein n=1 Tax=Diversispora epigaea TaxID=1348612 RepID=A0A397J4Q6_9GLOM|nr:hypothetical protein Glove_109g268 [Diversispora epigaea]
MSLNFFDKLSQNFIELLNDNDYDVIIQVVNEEKTLTNYLFVQMNQKKTFFTIISENLLRGTKDGVDPQIFGISAMAINLQNPITSRVKDTKFAIFKESKNN